MITDDRVPDLTRDDLDRYPVGVITLDRAGRIVHYNRAESAFSRLKPHDVIGRAFFDEVAPCAAVRDFQGRFEEFARATGDGADRFDFAFDFAWGRHEVTITLLRRAGRDEITVLVKLRSAARRAPLPHSELAAAIPSPAGTPAPRTLVAQWVEEDGRIWWSADIVTLFGLPPGTDPRAETLRGYVHPDDRAAVDEATGNGGTRPVTFAYRLLRADGGERNVVEHVSTLVDARGRRRFGTIVDVTERERAERSLRRSADHDPLTGLPNRRLLLERLEEALRAGEPVAVLFVDLDRFKHVNDTAGHAVGDALLRLVASRLVNGVRPGDTVARLNGDEFVLLLRDMPDAQLAAAVSETVLDTVSRPYVIDEEQHFVTASIGVALAPSDASTADDVVHAADVAMYYAKERGANAALRYDEQIGRDAGEQVLRENELRRAIDDGQFELYFQPIVDARTERTVKAEALIRWNHPQRGVVAPGEFIALAERTGLIVPLGTWVAETACARIRAWDDAGVAPIALAINVSPLQFRDRRFADVVRAAIAAHGIDPGRLELELTESLAERFDDTMESMLDLKLLGVRLSIDDFGTGYSALAYLKYLPIDTLKLDRSFVSGIASHPLDGAIATTVVRLANDLGLMCVAEGVEDAAQRDALRAIGATHLQGYYFSRPLPERAFLEHLGTFAAAGT